MSITVQIAEYLNLGLDYVAGFTALYFTSNLFKCLLTYNKIEFDIL